MTFYSFNFEERLYLVVCNEKVIRKASVTPVSPALSCDTGLSLWCCSAGESEDNSVARVRAVSVSVSFLSFDIFCPCGDVQQETIVW